MQKPKRIYLAPADMDDDGISTSQTPGGAGDLTITGALASGGIATLDMPRRVMITCSGNNSARTFTIYGTADGERAISETITGPNATAASSLKDYKTITRVAISGASTGTVKVGTTDGSSAGASTPALSSPWVPQDRWRTMRLGIGCIVTGTINYGIQHTLDDVFPAINPPNPAIDTYFNPRDHQTIANKTANADSDYEMPKAAVRAIINSYSTGATLTVRLNPGAGA